MVGEVRTRLAEERIIRVSNASALEEGVPVALIARVGKDEALVEHPEFGIVNIRVIRIIVCALMASAGAVGQAT